MGLFCGGGRGMNSERRTQGREEKGSVFKLQRGGRGGICRRDGFVWQIGMRTPRRQDAKVGAKGMGSIRGGKGAQQGSGV